MVEKLPCPPEPSVSLLRSDQNIPKLFLRACVSPSLARFEIRAVSSPSYSFSPRRRTPLGDAARGGGALSLYLADSGGTCGRAPLRRPSLRHASVSQRCCRERGPSAAGVRRAAARRRRHAAAGGAAGRRDIRLHRPPIRFGSHHLTFVALAFASRAFHGTHGVVVLWCSPFITLVL